MKQGSGKGAEWLLFCNEVWHAKQVPSSWHLQQVTLIFKKGDPGNCENYRPICLLAAAYKIFAMVLLKRLLEAGADDRLWPSQYGFRKRRGTEDALHCVRRAVELAWSQRGGHLHVMALDWAKAFDSINPGSLLDALRRFGIPEPFVAMVEAIYTERSFQVRECGFLSEPHKQLSGICQGCPLSPFLFVIVMSVLMHNARALLSAEAAEAVREHSLFDVLYADDTIILGTSTKFVQELAAAVEAAGAEFGMTLHWGKTQALAVCSNEPLQGPDGSYINDSGSLVYLGGLLTADGRSDSELSRRLGLAMGEYRGLRKMWGHANLTTTRKVELLNSLVVSKLLYGLSTMWLGSAQRRRIDGFYARALRRILGIPSSFISRVSNKCVFERAAVRPLSDQLLHRQLVILGKAARAQQGDGMRADVFIDDTFLPCVGRFVRRVGRPRQEWTTEVYKAGAAKFGSIARLDVLLKDRGANAEQNWKNELRRLFKGV